MSYFYIFLIGGSILVFLVLQFEKQQRRRVNTLLKNTNDVQPLLMMQSLGQKLNKINTVLAGNVNNNTVSASIKQEIELQLRQLTFDYNKGNISMQVYNKRLTDLLEKAGAEQ